MDRLVNYYLLCSADTGKTPHVVDSLSTEKLDQIISKKEQRDYLRKVDGHYVAAETVIGGEEFDEVKRGIKTARITVFH